MAEAREPITFIARPGDDVSDIREEIADDPDVQLSFEEMYARTRDSESEVQITVSKVPTTPTGEINVNGRTTYLFASPVDLFTLDQLYEKVRTEYMFPHETEITIRVICTKKGRRGNLFNAVQTIRRGAKDKSENADATAGVMQAVQHMLAEQRQSSQKMFEQFAMRGLQAPQSNILEQLVTLTPLIKIFMDSRASGGSGVGAIKEAVEAATMLRELMPDKGGSSRESDGTLGAITAGLNALPALRDILAKLPAPAAPATPQPTITVRAVPVVASQSVVPPAQPGTVTTVTEPPGTPASPGAHSVLFLQLAENLNKLTAYVAMQKQIGADVDAKKFAQLTVGELPDPLPGDLTEMLFAQNCREQFESVAPAIATQREWFDEFFAALRAEYEDDPTE